MALSFGNRHRNLTSNVWTTQRQQLLMRKQHSFIETGNSNGNGNRGNAISIANKERSVLTRGISVGRSYDGIRHKLNAAPVNSLRNAGSYACLQRQSTLEQEIRLKTINKQKEATLLRNSKNSAVTNSSGRLNFTRRNTCVDANHCDSVKIKDRSIVAWSSTTSLFKPENDDKIFNLKKKNSAGLIDDNRTKETRRASTTSNPLQQRVHSSVKAETNKINLSIVLPQAVKTSLDSEIVPSDIESSIDSGLNTDTTIYPPAESQAISFTSQQTIQAIPSSTVPTQLLAKSINHTNSAIYRRAQFRNSHLNATSAIITTTTSISNATTSNASTSTTTETPTATSTSTPSAQPSLGTGTTLPFTIPTTFSASPSLSVQRRPPLVRAMSAPVRPLDVSSKGSVAASKRKPRRRRIITRNISCDKSAEQDFLSNEIINGKKILTRSRSAVASDVITLVSLMSSEGSDSEREDIKTAPSTANSRNSESSPTRRAPSLRKTGKSVSFQENYPPNFQLASKEYSHMIRRGSIAPLTARIRMSNRPPTAPPGSIFLNMTSNSETIDIKDRGEIKPEMTNMSEKAEIKEPTTKDNSPEYVFPDYVRSIKERECWKLYQKMYNKGVNVSYDTILRGMLTPTEFRQIQKQRELEEARERAAEAAIDGENIKTPSQSAIDRLSEALLKK